jgi:hypothetical protein
MAGVGAWAARRQPPITLAGRLHPSLAGFAVASIAAGAGALVGKLVPRMEPLWPGYAIEAAQWPALAAMLEGLQVLVSAGVVVFMLHWLTRVTATFTRSRWIATAVIVVALTGVAMVVGRGASSATAAGLVTGLVVAVSVYALLRFDYRAVPAFVAGGMLLHAAQNAAQKGSSDAWTHAALAATGAIAAAWAVTRYIERSRSLPETQ